MPKGLKNLLYKERLKELHLFSLEKAQGATHQSIPVHKGLQSCKEDRGCLFTKNHREKRRDNGYKLHQEIIIFYSENN